MACHFQFGVSVSSGRERQVWLCQTNKCVINCVDTNNCLVTYSLRFVVRLRQPRTLDAFYFVHGFRSVGRDMRIDASHLKIGPRISFFVCLSLSADARTVQLLLLLPLLLSLPLIKFWLRFFFFIIHIHSNRAHWSIFNAARQI